MRIILGVSAGIAAYKSVLLLRLLTEAGHNVRVVPTDSALRFVGAATWEALSHEPVTASVFDGAHSVDHVRLGREADLVIVAPATADVMARAAAGRADDLLTATLLTARCPAVFAPAMHTEMWQHPATVANVETLRARGNTVLEVADGRLTGADTGPGRLMEPADIAAAALALVSGSGATAAMDAGESEATDGPLTGKRVVVSAGGTREPLDPVRFLGNNSSGRQGVALAARAAARGARVHLVAANVTRDVLAELPATVTVTHVGSAAELDDAMTAASPSADVLIMAAAVADFRPARASAGKIKKHAADGEEQPVPVIELVANPDILRGLTSNRRSGQVIVGFAAETGDAQGDALTHGRAKARRKGADLLAVNEVGTEVGFGDVDNAVVLLTADGTEVGRRGGSKTEVAEAILDAIGDLVSSS